MRLVSNIVTVSGAQPDILSTRNLPSRLTLPMLKFVVLVAVRLSTSTVIFPVVAPVGTVVVMLVAVGVPVIAAIVPLNLTMLFAGVILKFVPVIVT
jgi:hypothetical protein